MGIINKFQNEISKDLYDHSDGDDVCFLCNDPDYSLLYKIEDYNISFKFEKCSCGIVKQIPMPNDRFFKDFFNSEIFFSSKGEKENKIWGYYDYIPDEKLRFLTSKRRLKKLNQIFKNKSDLEILKIGPATGSFLGIAKQMGHNVHGIDMSERFIEFAKKTYDINIKHGQFEHQGFEDGKFDIIVMFSVLENINNIDKFFSEVYRVLKPGGYFVFNFVDMKNNLLEKIQKEKYFIYRPPVCYTFTLPVMNKVLNKYKLKPEKMFKDVRCLSIEKILSLLGWKTILRLFTFIKLNKLYFPIYTYPSKIIVAGKTEISDE